jgi:ribonucleotide reductase alpha subunit
MSAMNIPYGSKESISLARDIMSFITYESKMASVEIGGDRGSFSGFEDSMLRQGFLYADKYGYDDTIITREQWELLDNLILLNGIRHATTTALPPT